MFDLIAARPQNEASLKQACTDDKIDIISLDLTQRTGYPFRFPMLGAAIRRGAKFEICYSPGVIGTDTNQKRMAISNIIQLIRVTRGKGIIISSGATKATGIRAPHDLINLATVWGLKSDVAKNSVSEEARKLVLNALLKRTSYRGAVDIINGGERKAKRKRESNGADNVQVVEQDKSDENPERAAAKENTYNIAEFTSEIRPVTAQEHAPGDNNGVLQPVNKHLPDENQSHVTAASRDERSNNSMHAHESKTARRKRLRMEKKARDTTNTAA
jgi:hypothetical protein